MSFSTLALAAALAAPATDPVAVENTDTQVIIVTAPDARDQAERETARTPGGADTVGYQDYADRTVISLRDALAFSPGVYLQPRYGQEVRISIRGSGISRGFHMRGLTLLQDGVPINLADDNGDFQELDPVFFSSLQVFRGSNALRYGASTLGGAVNGITPRGTQTQGFYARADGGSFNTARLLLTAGGTSGPGDFWVGVSGDTSDGDRDHARRRSVRFNGNAGIEVAPGLTTRFYGSANAIYQQLPGALTRSVALTDPTRGNFVGDQRRDIASIRIQNRTTLTLPDGELNVGIFMNDKQLYHPIFEVIDNDSFDRGAYARMEWARGPFELTIGGEFRIGDTDAKRYVNVNGRRGAPTFQADQRARTSNVYGELRFRPVDPLSLIAGVVWTDGWREQQINFSRGFTSQFGRAEFSQVSPKLGVLFDVGEGIQLYGNISRSAELPGFSELGQITTFVNLDAQRGWTKEVGTRGNLNGVEWDVSYYRADLTGELLQFTVDQSIPASTFNADQTVHQGVEAGLTIAPSDWLRLRGTYLWSDFRFDGDRQYGDNRLPVVPVHMLRGEVRIGTDALHVAPNVEWVPRGAFADYRNTTRAPAYALLGVTAGASVTRGVDVFLDARNLTNKRAIGDISAVVLATSGSAIYQPVERRALFGGIRTRF
ncbi:TonB-dependent receptor family protein [Sphingomonas sp. FW199]|uniref:TonB-dependent receptor family protein n=1 Tax=Sphingomonas sp. FW199 TaxID=3400217 RepID=UPI003CEB2618